MNTELKEQIKAHQKTQRITTQRQQLWLQEKQAYTQATLEQLVTDYNISGKVASEKDTSNMKPVYLDLGQVESGIAKLEGENINVPYIKVLGCLFYTPVHNGMISVIVRLPYIKDLMQAHTPKLLETIAPKEITKDVIENNLIEFFKELQNWENQGVNTHNPIGF